VNCLFYDCSHFYRKRLKILLSGSRRYTATLQPIVILQHNCVKMCRCVLTVVVLTVGLWSVIASSVDKRFISVASAFADYHTVRILLWLIIFSRMVFIVPSVLWRCWLGGRKGIRPVKNCVVGCWHGHLSGARCRLTYGPADATATHWQYIIHCDSWGRKNNNKGINNFLLFCFFFNTWQKLANFFTYIKERISYTSVYLILACVKNFA